MISDESKRSSLPVEASQTDKVSCLFVERLSQQAATVVLQAENAGEAREKQTEAERLDERAVKGCGFAENPFDLLQVSRRATLRDVKRAYHDFSLKWHPDRRPKHKSQKLADRRQRNLNAA